MKSFNLSLLLLLLFSQVAYAQDDLLKQLEESTEPVDQKVTGTFKGTRLINGHTVETRPEGTLDFIISHRFGRVNSGSYQFFGLDDSNIRLGLDYAITDRLTIGVGRNSFEKIYDGLVKYKILWQESGEKNMPVSLVWYSNMAIKTFKRPDLPMNFKRKLAYTHQAILARKFNKISLQLAPTLVHRNLVPRPTDKNNLYALGMGGKYQVTPGTAINLEYIYRANAPDNDRNHNAVAIGVDIETGGHVFQLHLTNSRAMTESGFIPSTTGDFWDGDIHFGFNISRTFQLKNKNKDW
ncbi:DUF5777 family beta-barrel protein [Echinicola jeungdonensis]|uniref:DUF5777 family beta-barrel protein n=1 Tax=Echinicola jeungdonensis TaxID=709343 RepID=A0ABV5J0I9_9BACT|nr:DUF5777 family beta-barrel protein [Echinicola jeungdonensis]MDN3667778.1 DUF5777 family beta-barrel protein [Echinicola jeungdonensis]